MSESDELSPEERVRRIEQEAEYLEQEMSQTRDAVHRARQADSLASPGTENSVSSARPQPEGVERPDPEEKLPEELRDQDTASRQDGSGEKEETGT